MIIIVKRELLMTGERVRKSNVELLRIVGMLMIVSYHYVIHGVVQSLWGGQNVYWNNGSIENKLLSSLFLPGGSVGVFIFFIITGYFQIDKDSFSLKRIICQIQYYGSLFMLIGMLTIILGIDLVEESICGYVINGIVAPVTTNIWWFGTSYVLLMLLSPYINNCYNKLNKTGICVLMIVSLVASILHQFIQSQYYMLVVPVFYYCIGATIRRWITVKKGNLTIKIVGVITSWLINSALLLLKLCPELMPGLVSNYIDYLNLVQIGIFVPLCGISIFILFLSLPNFYSKRINTIASTTFGVYLLHDSGIARQLIWNNILHVGQQFEDCYYFAYAIISILLVFVMGALFDRIRKRYIEPWQFKIWDLLKGIMFNNRA